MLFLLGPDSLRRQECTGSALRHVECSGGEGPVGALNPRSGPGHQRRSIARKMLGGPGEPRLWDLCPMLCPGQCPELKFIEQTGTERRCAASVRTRAIHLIV